MTSAGARTALHLSITASAALELVTLARDHAMSHGWEIAVSIVDMHGIELACLRMDGAAPAILGFAGDKAYTALSLSQPSDAVFAEFEHAPRLRMGATGRGRILVWGGGVPIRQAGRIIGAIGVSGAAEADDIACARAALRGIGFDDEADDEVERAG